jgi:hypothetical protein
MHLLLPHLCRPLPLPDASCKALVAFLRAAATAAAANAAKQASAATSSSSGPDATWASGYSLSGHALLLEGLACRAAGRDTVAAALEGLVEVMGGSAPWLVAGSSSSSNGSWQRQVSELQERWVSRHVCVNGLRISRIKGVPIFWKAKIAWIGDSASLAAAVWRGWWS